MESLNAIPEIQLVLFIDPKQHIPFSIQRNQIADDNIANPSEHHKLNGTDIIFIGINISYGRHKRSSNHKQVGK